MKQTVEEAEKEYAKSVIDSFGTNGVPSSISAIKGMIALGFENGAEWHARQSPWISVEERLPEPEEEVLLYDSRSIRHYVIGQLRKEKRYNKSIWALSNGFVEDDDITHWMPIPSFDEIIEANKDVLQRIKEKGD